MPPATTEYVPPATTEYVAPTTTEYVAPTTTEYVAPTTTTTESENPFAGIVIYITVPEDLGVQQVEARELGLSYHDFYQIDAMVQEDPDFAHLEYYENRVTAYVEQYPEVLAQYLNANDQSAAPETNDLETQYAQALNEVEEAKQQVDLADSDLEKHQALAAYSSAESEAGEILEKALSSNNTIGTPEIKNASGAANDPCDDSRVIVAPPIDLEDDTEIGLPPTVMVVEDPILEVEETVDELIITPQAAQEIVASCDVSQGILEIQIADKGWQTVIPGQAKVLSLDNDVETIDIRLLSADTGKPTHFQTIEIDRVGLLSLLTPEDLAQLTATQSSSESTLPWWPILLLAGLLLLIILLLKSSKKSTVLVTADLFVDYEQWKQTFIEDLPERQKFSDRMVPGLLDDNQLVIVGYGVDIAAMSKFVKSEEFKERTRHLHAQPKIHQILKPKMRSNADVLVTADLFVDYEQWKQTFIEDLPERQKFSDRMVPGLLDDNQLVIVGYGVDIAAMSKFVKSEEFKERTRHLHAQPKIHQIKHRKK